MHLRLLAVDALVLGAAFLLLQEHDNGVAICASYPDFIKLFQCSFWSNSASVMPPTCTRLLDFLCAGHFFCFTQRGGAIHIEGRTLDGTDVEITSCDFRNNDASFTDLLYSDAGRGGGAYLKGVKELKIRTSTFSNNRAVRPQMVA